MNFFLTEAMKKMHSLHQADELASGHSLKTARLKTVRIVVGLTTRMNVSTEGEIFKCDRYTGWYTTCHYTNDVMYHLCSYHNEKFLQHKQYQGADENLWQPRGLCSAHPNCQARFDRKPIYNQVEHDVKMVLVFQKCLNRIDLAARHSGFLEA